jgi:hypothetical protein
MKLCSFTIVLLLSYLSLPIAKCNLFRGNGARVLLNYPYKRDGFHQSPEDPVSKFASTAIQRIHGFECLNVGDGSVDEGSGEVICQGEDKICLSRGRCCKVKDNENSVE